MKVFRCQSCGGRVYFENNSCLSCGSALGFIPEISTMSALEAAGKGHWRPLEPAARHRLYRNCGNAAVEAFCNWIVPAEHTESEFCLSCSLSRSIPDLGQDENRALWGKLERAKRRLIYSLQRLNLPVVPKWKDERNGLAFDFLANATSTFPDEEGVLTGHSNGVITINVKEADDAVREKMRLDMREVYRTVLGHFRHESGHYYWDCLVRDHPEIDRFRSLFGDERADYHASLQRHYKEGAPNDWQKICVTPYATAHPWEDWAETWAHYLHIMDTVETASHYGMELETSECRKRMSDPFNSTFETTIGNWFSLCFVLNSLNRSMGVADPYPFVLSKHAIEKLSFVHAWIERSQIGSPALAQSP